MPFDYIQAKKIRILLKMIQNELAAKLGITQSTISRYENGRQDPFSSGQYKAGLYVTWLKEQGYKRK